MKQSPKPNSVLRKMLLLLIAPAALLTGCAHNSTVCQPASPALPTAPSVSTPLPPVSYSLSASEAIKSWQGKLTGTRLMSD